MIKAVIFDMDGVILDSLEANASFFQDLLLKAGYKFTPEEYSPIFHLPMKEVVRHLTKSEDEDEITKIWQWGVDRAVRYPVELVTASEGVEEIMEELSKKYKIALVTSRVNSSIYETETLRKLKKYFNVVVGYEGTEKHKPEPDPLLLAAKKLNIKPQEAVYIGDLDSDVKAAKAAGMKMISYPNPLEGADKSVNSLSKIPELIEEF